MPTPRYLVILPLGLCVALACSADASPATNQAAFASAQESPGTLGPSLRNEVNAAIGRGLDWLASQQKEDGSWSDNRFPALTALPLWAFAQSAHPDRKAVVEKAVKSILSCVQTNGGIYREVPGQKGGGLSNYNTAICMTALHAVNDPALVPVAVIQNARKLIAGAQHSGDDVYDGGFGYDKSTGRAYTDLLNTYYAVEAMRRTADVEDLRGKGEARADIDWSRTVKFIERMQNKPEAGTNEAGGFVYNPTDAKAGTLTNAAGVVYFRSYGSITYAGLLALIYAEVSRDDVRVQSALDWAARRWSLDENPGMGNEGLFFFYEVLTRGLSAAGRDMVVLQDGTHLNWKAEVAKKLVGIQKIDAKTGQGYWENETGRYWENNPVLVTSYCLLALELL